MRHGRRHRGWGPPGGWGEGGARPPWWPEGEAWPAQGPEAWRGMRRRFARRAALFAATVVFVLVALVAAVVWLVGLVLGNAWTTAVLALAVLLLLLVAMGRVVRAVRLATAPLGELIEASGRVEAGHYGVTVPERGPREVRAMTRAFNAMSQRLAATDADRRRLLADVSHELRTPLAVIQGNVEGMLDGLYPSDREGLERILAETQQLERMIEDLRTLSLADAGALALHREPTDLGLLVQDVVAGFAPGAEAAGIGLDAVVADAVPELELDPVRIRQVVGNLVSNALRHTPAGGRVTATVRATPDAVALEVADTGSGMEAEAAARAFDRFWRTGEGAGAGLGLAIVRDLVAAHGGRAELESAPGAGTTVRCTFPLVR